MTFETPVVREMRLEKERALERETREAYTTDAIARKYKSGEITYL
jgi:hypothetical protein